MVSILFRGAFIVRVFVRACVPAVLLGSGILLSQTQSALAQTHMSSKIDCPYWIDGVTGQKLKPGGDIGTKIDVRFGPSGEEHPFYWVPCPTPPPTPQTKAAPTAAPVSKGSIDSKAEVSVSGRLVLKDSDAKYGFAKGSVACSDITVSALMQMEKRSARHEPPRWSGRQTAAIRSPFRPARRSRSASPSTHSSPTERSLVWELGPGIVLSSKFHEFKTGSSKPPAILELKAKEAS